jgi:hypothetical protein
LVLSFVGLDIEGNSLALVQRLEAGLLDSRDMQNIASAFIRFDEAVAALGIEKADGTCHGHPEAPFPWLLRRQPARRRG